jgi:phage terminase large subunit-like protein
MAATLDKRVHGSDAVFEAKFMLPWSFSEQAAAEKYMPQLQQLRTEMLAFPHGLRDDQVDSISQALSWMSRPRHRTHAVWA